MQTNDLHISNTEEYYQWVSNPIERGLKNLGFYKNFISEYGSNTAYGNLWPGLNLGELIVSMFLHRSTTNDPGLVATIDDLLAIYNQYYERLTGTIFSVSDHIKKKITLKDL